MEEIKFRVWCDNKMHCKDLGAFVSIGGMTITPIKCKIMQFTGLLDKNDKEIYEGDVIKMVSEWYEGDCKVNGFIGTIIYDDGAFCVKGDKPFDYLPLNEVCIFNYKFEVMGDVYQNPDIIK